MENIDPLLLAAFVFLFVLAEFLIWIANKKHLWNWRPWEKMK